MMGIELLAALFKPMVIASAVLIVLAFVWEVVQ